MYNRYDEATKIEQKIIEIKDKKWKEIIRPVDAFITFKKEDGMIVADSLEHMDDNDLPEFLG